MTPGAPSTEESVVEFGEFRLNLGTREMFRGEEPMPLTSGEFAVLKSLVTNAREPMSRDKLMNMARGRRIFSNGTFYRCSDLTSASSC
ncbi:hypothetical protein O9993_04370 [Vibrio lentus]|nr:hypothetical protein [Vibrio lentus]